MLPPSPAVPAGRAAAHEYAAIRALVQREYSRQGYTFHTRPTAPDLDETAVTRFVVRQQQRIIGTIALFRTSRRPLPSETLYPTEVAALRAAGYTVAEAGRLAIDTGSVRGIRRRLDVLSTLFALVLHTVITERIQQLITMVNPRHERLYNMLGFTQLGPERHYPAVAAPAVAMVLDTTAIQPSSPPPGLVARLIIKKVRHLQAEG